jgi:hypothetical protein
MEELRELAPNSRRSDGKSVQQSFTTARVNRRYTSIGVEFTSFIEIGIQAHA